LLARQRVAPFDWSDRRKLHFGISPGAISQRNRTRRSESGQKTRQDDQNPMVLRPASEGDGMARALAGDSERQVFSILKDVA
jgi:hypothetical protein